MELDFCGGAVTVRNVLRSKAVLGARALALLMALSLCGCLLSATAAPSQALTLGIGWSGDYGGTAAEMDVLKRSGATLVRVPVDSSHCYQGNWDFCDSYFKAAWENGLAIQPYLVRSANGGTRFPTPSDPGWGAWYAWSRAVVERYGYNGIFWEGKANPKPVTDWEVWNEPNLVSNNPYTTKTSCQAQGQTFYEAEGTCVQPEAYGALLVYTASAIQTGSQARAGKNTGVLFGGIAFPYGDPYNNFLTKAYKVSGVYSSYTGLSVHPYGFDFVHSPGSKTIGEFQTEVSNVRSHLNTLPWGPSRTLWITELGWPLNNFGNPSFPAVKNESEQARLMTESINWTKSVAASKNIQVLIWYNARDLNIGDWAYIPVVCVSMVGSSVPSGGDSKSRLVRHCGLGLLWRFSQRATSCSLVATLAFLT